MLLRVTAMTVFIRVHEVGAWNFVITTSVCVRVSFLDDVSEAVRRIVFILHTHIPLGFLT